MDKLQFNKINRFLATPPYLCLWYHQINRKMTHTYDNFFEDKLLEIDKLQFNKSTGFWRHPLSFASDTIRSTGKWCTCMTFFWRQIAWNGQIAIQKNQQVSADTPSFTSHCQPYWLRFDSIETNAYLSNQQEFQQTTYDFLFGSARENEGKLILLLISTNQHNFWHLHLKKNPFSSQIWQNYLWIQQINEVLTPTSTIFDWIEYVRLTHKAYI